MTMNPAWRLVRRVLDEEIERYGVWWDTENCWVVARGERRDGAKIDEISPVLAAVSERTGVAEDRLRQVFRPQSHLMGTGGYVTSSHAHQLRRLADGTLRRIDRSTFERHERLFEVYEPVPTSELAEA